MGDHPPASLQVGGPGVTDRRGLQPSILGVHPCHESPSLESLSAVTGIIL